MVQVKIHDFRVTDRVLAATDPDAPDTVYVGRAGKVAAPFVIVRSLSGPGGVYIDACSLVDADGTALGTWERRFELDGESKPLTIRTEVRGLSFPQPGIYYVQYSIFDEGAGTFSFTVLQEPSPAEGIIPGPLDAALAKSTILWLRVQDVDEPVGAMASYRAARDYPVWYGYEDGRIYVLVGEGEQQVPGLTKGGHVRLIARSKDKRSQVVDVECEAEVLDKNNPAWERIASETLLGRRLNLKDAVGAVERWKKTCEIVVLSPMPAPVPASASAD